MTQQRKIDAALHIAYQYGQIEGDHHRCWSIDQMVRGLTGKEYDKWVADYENDGEYSWDTGTAP